MAMSVPCYKVILIGDWGVGKSALFRRFIDNSFSTAPVQRSYMGLDCFSKKYTIHNREIKFEVWDTAGIERFATLSTSYYHNAAAAILCYSSVDRDSFNSLPQHLLETIMHAKSIKMFLCCTKTDLQQTHDAITDSDIVQFEDQCDTALSATFRVSAKDDGRGVTDMFYAVAEKLVSDDLNKFRPKEPEQYRKEDQPGFQLHNKKSGGCCS